MTYKGGGRTYWFSSRIGVEYDPAEDEDRFQVPKAESNLLSSLCEGEAAGDPNGYHMPAIDIDFPCHLRETETPGHFHLLIDVPMKWEAYVRLLEALVEAGVVEPGYLRASLERGSTFLAREPWKEGHGAQEG